MKPRPIRNHAWSLSPRTGARGRLSTVGSTTSRAAAVALLVALAACAHSVTQSSSVPILTPLQRHCTGTTLLEQDTTFPGDCIVQEFAGGASHTIAQLRGGKPMIINFWASWCVYCIKEMPDLQRAYERAAGGVSFLGLDLLDVQGETSGAATALAQRAGARYPLAYDRNGVVYHQVCPCRGRPLMPTTVFLRADGTIAFLKFGPVTADELRSLIRTHLGTEV